MTDRPPRPRFALKIGIIGHRPDDLPKDSHQSIQDAISEALSVVIEEAAKAHGRHAQWFSAEPPLISMISALAEGSDRLAAHAALALKIPLFSCLPFEKTEYENDFKSTASLEEFHDLLARSCSLLELSGSRANRIAMDRAYELVGLTTVIQADLMVAVWDGGLSRGRGGTRDMIAATTRLGTPLIHIDPSGTQPTLVKWRGLNSFPLSIDDVGDLPAAALRTGLANVIEELVKPPGDLEEQQSMTRFLDETGPFKFRRLEWDLMLSLLGARGLRSRQSSSSEPAALGLALAYQLAPFSYVQKTTKMIQAFGWADAIGTHYSHMFRSAVVFNFWMAALTVASAATSTLVAPRGHLTLITAEVALILFVVINTVYGRWQRWHQRWFEGRELAERLRVALPFWAVGIWPRTFTGPEPTWGGWYARALMREQQMSEGKLDRTRLASYRAALIRLLRAQLEYHQATERSMHLLNGRLEKVSALMLVCSLVPAMVYIAAHDIPTVASMATFISTNLLNRPSANWEGYLTVCSVAFPAFATAGYGIRVIGDFEGTAERSQRSTEALNWLINALEQDDEDLTVMRARTYAAADVMLGEVSSWRLAAESRALAIPG
jgi:hypothetical protein